MAAQAGVDMYVHLQNLYVKLPGIAVPSELIQTCHFTDHQVCVCLSLSHIHAFQHMAGMQNCPPVLLTALVVRAYVQPSGLSRLPSLALQMPNSA